MFILNKYKKLNITFKKTKILLNKIEKKDKNFFINYLKEITNKNLKTKKNFVLKKNTYKVIHYNLIINFSINNIIMYVKSINGNIIIKASSGLLKYSGSQKRNKHALLNILNILKNENNFLANKKFILYIKGSRKNYNNLIIKYFKKHFKISILKINNLTPHNGCRPKKLKRLKNFFI